MLSSPWSGRCPLRGQDAVPLSTTQAAANVLCLPSGLPSALWLPALSCGLSCCCPESVAAPPQVVSYSTLQRPWRASWRRPRGAASGSWVLRRPLPTSRAVRCSVRPLGEQQRCPVPGASPRSHQQMCEVLVLASGPQQPGRVGTAEQALLGQRRLPITHTTAFLRFSTAAPGHQVHAG